MNIVKRSDRLPENRARSLQTAFSDWLGDLFSIDAGLSDWNPKADFVEKDKEYVVQADVPGADEKSVNVEIDDGVLTVSGKRNYEHEDGKDGYKRIERSYGSFSRSFVLPEDADAAKVTAGYEKGVLTVKIPKDAARKTQKVQIKVN